MDTVSVKVLAKIISVDYLTYPSICSREVTNNITTTVIRGLFGGFDINVLYRSTNYSSNEFSTDT